MFLVIFLQRSVPIVNLSVKSKSWNETSKPGLDFIKHFTIVRIAIVTYKGRLIFTSPIVIVSKH